MDNNKPELTVALAKGRLAERSIALFAGAGVNIGDAGDIGRRLVFDTPDGNIRFILVKPSDVPTYVDYGVADMGVAGKDTLLEENRALYEMLDLGFGKCRLCIAGFATQKRESKAIHESSLPIPPRGRLIGAGFRVATKYPNIARRVYEARGQDIEVIPLSGSIELGPLVGLSDVILDIVESGSTLRENGLVVLEEICQVSARLVVNRVSLKTRNTRIRALIEGISAQIQTEGKA